MGGRYWPNAVPSNPGHLPKRDYPEQQTEPTSISYLDIQYAFGWVWDEHRRTLCEVWDTQVSRNRFGIHLWRDLRQKYSNDLMRLTQLALEGKSIREFCDLR